MALSKFTIELDQAAIKDLVTNPHGLVATRVLTEAAVIVTRSAKIRAPIADFTGVNQPPPGTLYDSIAWDIGSDEEGLYATIHAIYYDIFLEKPARQMKRPKRTLRNALHDMPRIL